MLEDMNLSVNGHSKVPPGFRFHPTEEELLHYYLRKKVACQKIDLDVIRDVDLNKLEPWDIQETCKIGTTPQNEWYLFSHKDKKYPTGTRTNRATAAGFWKATGRDKVIHSSMRRIGMRKTLVFYKGRAPHGLKSDWIMHEYRLDLDNENNTSPHDGSGSDQGWVVCRVFKKKNYNKAVDHSPRNEGVLDRILMYMGPSSTSSSPYCKQENDVHLLSNIPSTPGFMHLPSLESPSDWVAVDRLVASQLHEDFSFCFDHHDGQLLNTTMIDSDNYKVVPIYDQYLHVPNSSSDAWDFGRPSTSDPLCRLSV